MRLRVGQTLASTVDATTVIVVRTPSRDVVITCGGVEMTDPGGAQPPAPTGGGAASWSQIGKRYTDSAGEVELLCTKPGPGELAVDGTTAVLKSAKPLPASD